MIRSSRKCAGLGLSLLVLAGAQAAHAAAGWTGFGTLTDLNQNPGVGPGNDLFFFNVSGATNAAGCSVTNGYYLNIVNDRQKRLFTMILTAHATGRNVAVYVTGTCHSPWGYAEVDGILLQ